MVLTFVRCATIELKQQMQLGNGNVRQVNRQELIDRGDLSIQDIRQDVEGNLMAL